MSKDNIIRQPSFVVMSDTNEYDDTTASTSGVASRLPASKLIDLDSNVNNDDSLIDMTPSGEVQMRVKKIRSQSGASSSSANNAEIDRLRKELVEHREAERRILSLLESHSNDDLSYDFRRPGNKGNSYEGGDITSIHDKRGLRGQGDQCFGSSTNPSWQVSSDMRTAGYGPVQNDRNWCVGTMAPSDRTNTNVGNELNNIVNSNSTIPRLNSVTSSQPIPNLLGSNSYIKPKKTPNFDGTTSWQDFLVKFEMVSAVNKWDDVTKAIELATNLNGVAQGVITDIEPAKRFDYNYLVSALTARFEPVNQENMYKVQLNSFYRKSNQSLPEMAQEIRRITRLAYPTAPVDIRNQLSKDCFIRAVNDPKMQLSIFQREPKTIDDCIRFGVEYESFTVDLKRQHNSKPGLRMMNETSESNGEFIVHLAKMSDQLEKLVENRNQNPSRGITCYYCGNKGHIKRECRKLEWDQNIIV